MVEVDSEKEVMIRFSSVVMLVATIVLISIIMWNVGCIQSYDKGYNEARTEYMVDEVSR